MSSDQSTGRAVLLTVRERQELVWWTNSRSTPASVVVRANLILALADGLSYREIERRFGASGRTVSLWKQRFVQERLAGLQGRHKGSQPRVSTPDVQARVSEAYQKAANSGTRWSGRKLARDLGLDKSTVQRILLRVTPRASVADRFRAALDPQFGDKAVGIVGLYLDPPHYAAVFVVRGETANQASIDVEWRALQYERHASRELYSALAGCQAAEQHPIVRFTDFLVSLVQILKWAPEMYILHHNREEETDSVGRFLGENPKVRCCSTPQYTTWVNLVGCWLSKVERDVVEDEAFTPISNLCRKLLRYIRSYSKSSRPFHWISGPWF
jgi:transposase